MARPSTPRPARSPDPVRLAAVRAYASFRQGGTFRPTAPPALREAQQRRLYANLLRGMVRHQRLLEAEAARLARRPAEELSPPVLAALVLGLYQVLLLQQADHAAVFETVELLGALGQARAKGLVNAVLRSALRERALPIDEQDATQRPPGAAGSRRKLPPGTAGSRPQRPPGAAGSRPQRPPGAAGSRPQRPLAERTSHPDWLVERWVRRYGAAVAERICEANNRYEASGVRVALGRIGRADLLERLAREDIRATPHPLLPGALLVTQLGALLESSAFAEGLCYVQDASSQLLASWIAPLLDGWVLDACCAPGGKLTHLIDLAGVDSVAGAAARSGPAQLGGTQRPGGTAQPSGTVRLVGMDASRERLRRVRENLTRLRLPAPPLVAGDAARLPFLRGAPEGGWQAVLLDVPCSATGMIRKYPELKWRKHAEDLVRLAAAQRELLDEAARALRPGGLIVYVTCSLEPEENEQQVDAFLARTPGFRRRSFREVPEPAGLGGPVAPFVTEAGDLQLLPDADRMGLYGAMLERAPASA